MQSLAIYNEQINVTLLTCSDYINSNGVIIIWQTVCGVDTALQLVAMLCEPALITCIQTSCCVYTTISLGCLLPSRCLSMDMSSATAINTMTLQEPPITISQTLQQPICTQLYLQKRNTFISFLFYRYCETLLLSNLLGTC